MHILHILHILHICAWWHVLQVFVVYFLNFQKDKNDRTAKTGSHPTAKWCKHSFAYIARASSEVWTLVVSTESRLPYQLGYRSLRHSSFHHCFVPQLRAQLLTYHHLQPSLPSFVLSNGLKAGIAIDWISRLPDSMDTASEVENANISQAERENSEARSIKPWRLPHLRNKSDKRKNLIYS